MKNYNRVDFSKAVPDTADPEPTIKCQRCQVEIKRTLCTQCSEDSSVFNRALEDDEEEPATYVESEGLHRHSGSNWVVYKPGDEMIAHCYDGNGNIRECKD